MHVHLPKPIHGWREFLGEVGVIVLGVLIALGAEQAVESLHIREIEAAEREDWLQLQDFQDAPNLDPASAMRLRELITRVVQTNDALDRYGRGSIDAAAQLHVRPATREPARAADLCRPLNWSQAPSRAAAPG